MDIRTNIPLKNYTTMGLGGNARFMAIVSSPNDIPELYSNAAAQQLPVYVLGGGSNTIVHDKGFDGIVVRNQIQGLEVIEDDASTTVLKVGAGMIWDELVEKSIAMNLTGIEAMSAIPGTVGAAPVQNIGAYGQELSDTFESLEAYDSQTGQFVTLTAEDCQFSYRNSIFRGESYGRYVITYVTLRLFKGSPQPPFYAALQDYFDQNGITLFTSTIVREAVSKIRADKLPDPKIKPNSGSFFKNAIIESWQLDELKQRYPDMPAYEMPGNNYKVPTGWLIESLGFKGKLLADSIRVNPKNALVLINESATSYAQLEAARNEIIAAVRDNYRIDIEQEPLELV